MSKDNPTIMVVEDETLLLQAITKKLKLSGMDVLSCASGQQAVVVPALKVKEFNLASVSDAI